MPLEQNCEMGAAVMSRRIVIFIVLAGIAIVAGCTARRRLKARVGLMRIGDFSGASWAIAAEAPEDKAVIEYVFPTSLADPFSAYRTDKSMVTPLQYAASQRQWQISVNCLMRERVRCRTTGAF